MKRAVWLAILLAGCTPKPADVLAAIQAGDHAELAHVLDRGGDPDAVGSFRLASGTYELSALSAAIHRHDQVALALLLGHRADPERRDPGLMGSAGRVPIATAAWSNDVAAILALIAHGARVDGDSGAKETPAALAANAGHPEALSVLLGAGANVDGAGADGTSYPPLALAAEAGCAACVVHLLAAGAHVDRRDILGITALNYAVIKENLAMVDLLLAAKADPMLANRAGWTPAFTAQYRGEREVMERFRRLGVTDFGMQTPPPLPPSGLGTIRVPVVEARRRSRRRYDLPRQRLRCVTRPRPASG